MFSRRQKRSTKLMAAQAASIKEILLEKLQDYVKEVQNEYKDKHQPLELNSLTGQLCSALEAIFIHGLKETFLGKLSSRLSGEFSPKMPEPSFWTFSLVFSHKQVITAIEKMPQVNTEVGRCRAWLRMALNDGLLVSYLKAMRDDRVSLSVHYEYFSFLRDSEKLDLLIHYLAGIEVFTFKLAVNVSMLNRWLPEPLELAGVWHDSARTAPRVDTGAVDALAALGVEEAVEEESAPSSSVLNIRTLAQPARNQQSYFGLLNEDEALRLILQATPVSLSSSPYLGTPEPPARSPSPASNPPASSSDQQNNGESEEDFPFSPQRSRSPSPPAEGSVEPSSDEAAASQGSALKSDTALAVDSQPQGEDEVADGAGTSTANDANRPTADDRPQESIFEEIFSTVVASRRLESGDIAANAAITPECSSGRISPTSLEWDESADRLLCAENKNLPEVCDITKTTTSDQPSNNDEEMEENIGSVSEGELTSKSGSNDSSDQSKDSSASCWCSTLGPKPGCKVCEERPSVQIQLDSQYKSEVEQPHGEDLIAQETECMRRKRACGVGFKEKPSIRVETFSLQKNLELLACLDLVPREKGIDAQDWRCVDCTKAIGAIFGPGRVCSFTKLYYCEDCHVDSLSLIPARLIYNWDARLYPVANSSLAFIVAAKTKPVIRLDSFNPSLVKFAPQLGKVTKLRKQLSYLTAYVTACSRAYSSDLNEKVNQLLSGREYMMHETDQYSIDDLEAVYKGELFWPLEKSVNLLIQHVQACLICSGRGFICEVCRDKRPVYPFNLDSTSQCQACCTVFHAECSTRLSDCPKCERIAARSLDNLVVQSKLTREVPE